MNLAFGICDFCSTPSWCYATPEGQMCRGCHVVSYVGAILFEPLGLTLLPWQNQLLRKVYGTIDTDTGQRKFWKAYAEVPGKNGKSFLLGALPLYHMDAEGVDRVQAFGCAAAKEQAGIVYRSAANLIEQNPDQLFRNRWKVLRSTFRIVHRPTNGYYRVISADGKINDGEEPSLAIFDELHRWSTARAQTLYHVMNKGTISRQGSLIWEITTAGSTDESPICWAEHQRAQRIIDGGEPDGRMCAVIFSADEERALREPTYWQSRDARVAANPSHEDNGGFLLDEKIVEEIEVIGKEPFQRYHLNLWTNKHGAWLSAGEWDRGNKKRHALVRRACYLGIDLSSTTDFTAMVAVFPDEHDISYDVLPWFWLPEDRVPDLERRLHVPLRRWIDDGKIQLTPGDYVDYSFIEQKILWCVETFDVQEICYDPWNATDIVTRLIKTHGERTVVKVHQSITHLSAPMKHAHRKILQGNIRHEGDPVLAWHANCVVARYDSNGNIAPQKPNLGRDASRIDGFAAFLTALSRAMINDEPDFIEPAVRAVKA